MQLMSARAVRSALVAAAVVLAVCLAGAAPRTPRLVQVWHVGDDIYTAGLADALERAFRCSPDFVLSNGNRPGTLVVTIPTNLDWKRRFGRTTVFYAVEFATADGRSLGVAKGSCSSKAFPQCAARIVANVRVAADKAY